MRASLRALLGSTCLALLPASGVAQPAIPDALYRPGMPAVLQPALPEALQGRDEIVRSFAEAYRARGRPQLALFWNRRFDDRVTDWTSGVRVSETDRARLDASLNGERTDGANAGSLQGALGVDLDRRRTVEAAWRAPDQVRPGLPEALALELESGFVSAMSGARAVVLDRAAIMRLQDRAERSPSPDGRRIETDALLEHAVLLVEVLATHHPQTPLGAVFHVSVKDVQTGEIVTSLSSDGKEVAEAAPQRWEINERGIVRTSGQRLETARLIGEDLALRTMAALADRWR